VDFSKFPGKIFLNNKYVNSKNAKIHILNHSLHFATSIFEGIGVYSGKPLFLKEHYKRLIMSSKLMSLNINKSILDLEKITMKLIKYNKIWNGYIRPIVFRSSHSMSPDTKLCKSILGIAAWNWSKLFNNNNGIALNISKFPRLNENIYPIHAKSSGSYQTSILSRIDAAKKKYDDCVMLDLKGNVAETTSCNIFWIKNDILYTSKEHSILGGITRKSVIKICQKHKVKIKIGDYKLKQLFKADHVFVTGTAAEIQTVRKIKNKQFSVNSNLIDFLKKKYEVLKQTGPFYIKNI